MNNPETLATLSTQDEDKQNSTQKTIKIIDDLTKTFETRGGCSFC